MGTPESTREARVRLDRAMALLKKMSPTRGSLSFMASMAGLVSLFFASMETTTPNRRMASRGMYQNSAIHSEKLKTWMVRVGRGTLSPRKTWENRGMTTVTRMYRMKTAKRMTTAG